MRKLLLLLAFLLVLGAPLAARLAMTRAPGAGESDLRLVVVTPNNQDIRREFARAFSLWHKARFGQGVELVYRTPGGSNDMVRLLTAAYAVQRDRAGRLPPEQSAAADIDVAWGGGDYTFDHELKPLGILRPIDLPDPAELLAAIPQPTLAGVKLYDNETDPATGRLAPRWIGICLSSYGIVYNPGLYARLRLAPPTTWTDLGVPRLSGWVALADPMHSGSAAMTYEMVLQRAMADAEDNYRRRIGAKPGARLDSDRPEYRAAIAAGWHRGMGELLMIAANARYFSDASTDPPNDVGNGEAAAGIAIDFYGRSVAQAVGPDRLRYVAPAGATAVTPDPVAILYGVRGERLLLATRFIEYLLSPEGQRLWALKAGTIGGPVERALHRSPIRRDLYAPGASRSDWADDVDPYAESSGFNERGEWMALFGDTRPLWAAAWIDSRDALRDAYVAILATPDAELRARRLAKLADLPIEMSDVAALAAERRRLAHDGRDVQFWQATQRERWAQRFRDHYAAARSWTPPKGSANQ